MPLIFLQLFAIFVLTQRTIVRYTSSIKKNKHTNGKEENEMKKYKIYFRINEYLMINDYEEIKGDLDSRVIAGKDEDDAISRLRKSLERYMKGTETRTYDLEIGSVEER